MVSPMFVPERKYQNKGQNQHFLNNPCPFPYRTVRLCTLTIAGGLYLTEGDNRIFI